MLLECSCIYKNISDEATLAGGREMWTQRRWQTTTTPTGTTKAVQRGIQ